MLLDQALEIVREVCEEKGQQQHLEIFLGYYMSSFGEPPAWGELGVAHALDQKQARNRAEAVVGHFRIALRQVLAEELGSAEATDEELATLLALL